MENMSNHNFDDIISQVRALSAEQQALLYASFSQSINDVRAFDDANAKIDLDQSLQNALDQTAAHGFVSADECWSAFNDRLNQYRG